MNTDSHFLIGDSHKVCEDYAINTNTEEDFLIAVSDGCSGGEFTDIFSRLLLMEAYNNFRRIRYLNCENIIKDATIKSQVNYDYLSDLSFYATLLYAYSLEKVIFARIVGDGTLVVKKRGEDYQHFNYKYKKEGSSKELPFYPYYFIEKGYESLGYDLFINGEKQESCIPEPLNFQKKDIEEIYLITDGGDSFYNKDNSLISIEDIVPMICNKNNSNGSFVQRKLDFTVNKLKKKGIKHYDDIAVAGVTL